MKGINYVSLVPVLIKGMQEQQALIVEQADKIADLERQLKEIEALKAEVTALAKLMKNQTEENTSESIGEKEKE